MLVTGSGHPPFHSAIAALRAWVKTVMTGFPEKSAFRGSLGTVADR